MIRQRLRAVGLVFAKHVFGLEPVSLTLIGMKKYCRLLEDDLEATQTELFRAKTEVTRLRNLLDKYDTDLVEVEVPPVKEAGPTVCFVCSDTHWVYRESGAKVACGYCPVPCASCMQVSFPFCEETPCTCRCHKSGPGYEAFRKKAT